MRQITFLAFISGFLDSNIMAQSPYLYKPDHKFQILARTGNLDIQGIQPEHSVNKNGDVAFIGQVQEPGGGPMFSRIYSVSVTRPNSLASVTPGITRADAHEFGPAISINNSGEILTRRIAFQSSALGTIPFSFVDRWTQSSGNYVTLESASEFFTEFKGFYGPTFHNNNRDYAFTAFDKQNNYLATSAGRNLKIVISSATPLPSSFMIADNRKMILRYGNALGGSISILPLPDVFPIDRIASPANGFAEVGGRPGISDDGNIIVFFGNLTSPKDGTKLLDPGPGIFAFLTKERRFLRLAGESGDKHLAPGEYWDDNADGVRNFRFHDGVDTDTGPVTGFVPDSQVVVNNWGAVAFIAKDANGQRGIFYTRINPSFTHYPTSDPLEVVSTGQTIDGIDGTIVDIALSDSFGDRGRPGDLVFWTHFSNGNHALVATRPGPPPLILIPGIAASKLERPNDELWLSIQSEDIRELSLAPGEVQPDIRPTDILRSFFGKDIHGLMVNMIQEKGGYRECIPLTACKSPDICEYSLPSDHDVYSPNLFLFPYDWRVSNMDNAIRLRQWVRAVREAYPNVSVDFLCHSMGGLMGRRYFLQNPKEHFVSRCVTIGTPVLGAPVAYKRLLTGDFFDEKIIDKFTKDAIKDVLPNFRGFHELFPSPVYFSLNPGPVFVERGWDINGNANGFEDYSPDMVRDLFDKRFQSQPVSWGNQFHTPAQDVWSSSGHGVNFLHISGVRAFADTPIQVQAVEKAFKLFKESIHTEQYIALAFGNGDQTVPIGSSHRPKTMLAPETLQMIVRADRASGDDADVYVSELSNHVALTRNPRVIAAALYFLRTGMRLSSDPHPEDAGARPSADGQRPDHREFLCVGCGEVSITDPSGRRAIRDEAGFLYQPPGITYFANNNTVQICYPPDGEFQFAFRGASEQERVAMIEIKAVDLHGGAVSSARFYEVPFLPGFSGRLRDNGAPPYDLEIDVDSNGSFDSKVTADFVVSGARALDEEPPDLEIRRTCQGLEEYVEIAARDNLGGNPTVIVQHSGHGAVQYTGPIPLSDVKDSVIIAFATDTVGNRSKLFELPVLPLIRTTRLGDEVRISWERSCWPLVLESAGSYGPSSMWEPVSSPVTHIGGEDIISIVPEQGTAYFRLRLKQ